MLFTKEDKDEFFAWHEKLRARGKEPRFKSKWWNHIFKNCGVRQYPGWGHWSEIRLLLYFKRYKEAARRIGDASLVLDHGCGSGYGCDIIKKYSKSKQIIGYDIDEKAIEYATDFHGQEGVFFTAENQTGIFDAIVSIESIEHTEDIPQTIEYFRDHLQPGGKLIMSTPNMELSNIGFYKSRMKKPGFEKTLDKYFAYEVFPSNPLNWMDERPLSWYFVCARRRTGGQ